MALVDTLIRKFSLDAKSIRKKLRRGKTVSYAMELRCEPGEVLITLLMEADEIELSIREAMKKALYPTTNFQVKNINCCGRLIQFTIEPSS